MENNLEDHFNSIELGELAKKFLETDYYKKLVKPAIDGMFEILGNIRNVPEEHSEYEVKARILALNLIESFSNLIENGYKVNALHSQVFVDKTRKKKQNLYREK